MKKYHKPSKKSQISLKNLNYTMQQNRGSTNIPAPSHEQILWKPLQNEGCYMKRKLDVFA
jgi:hypothetical protein